MIRSFSKILTILILFSCNDRDIEKKKELNQPTLTEREKRLAFRKLPLKDFEDNEAFTNFIRQHYPSLKAKNIDNPYPYAFEEEYIDTTKIDTSREFFRVIVEPCFRLPYAFILEKIDGHYTFTTKLTNGDCNFPGNLFLTMTPSLSDSMGISVFQTLDSLNYWAMKPENVGVYLDGETWTYEAINHGNYNLIRQRLPQYCKQNDAVQLFQLVLKLKEISKLDKILVALGKRKNGF